MTDTDTTPHWSRPLKPAALTESRLIAAILDGTFPVDSTLPAERELAAQLGITRPTLREVLQRLARDGWLEIRQGKPTRVRNYLQEGNLAVLVAIALHPAKLPADFVPNVLSVRILLSPAYTRLAIERAPQEVAALLQESSSLPEEAAAYAHFDWQVHRQLAISSGNPFYALFVNSVSELYDAVGTPYFLHAEARAHSQGFYRGLLVCIHQADPAGAAALAERIMQESRDLWIKLVG
jgi:GntR family negative regulator for fad regulon and positive regulator of fabA